MAKQASRAVGPQGAPGVSWHQRFSIEEREAMIRDGAYYRFLRRGGAHGHDMEDWLAAEAELDSGAAPMQPAGAQPLAVQQSGVHGMAQDAALKRIIKQHPHKAIPQIEGIEPGEAPFRE